MQTQPIETRIARTALWVIWLSTIGAGLALTATFVMLTQSLVTTSAFFADLAGEFGLAEDAIAQRAAVSPVSSLWAFGSAFVWMIPDMWGVYLFLSIRMLFVGIRSYGVFAMLTAQRVRQVGWALVLMAPISMIVTTATSMMVHRWMTPNSLHGQVSLEDTHIYALVIGLVIVALGHIMVDASEISEENRAFV